MKHYYFHFVLVLASAGLSLAQSPDVSLGDVARNHRAHGKSAMVFNDENTHRTIASSDSASIPVTSNTTAGQSVGTQASKNEAGKPAPPDSRADTDKLKKQLDSLKQQQSVWSKSAKDYEDKLANEPSDFRRQVDEEALQNDKQNVQFYQQKINQVETELSKAQETSQTAGSDQPNHTSSGGHGNQP